MSEQLSEKKIISLWRDKQFSGYGLGLISFKQELESRFKVKLSDRYVKDCLLKIPEYLQNQLRRKKFERRKYYVHGFGVLYQGDVATMPKFQNLQFFLVLIDVYTSFLWTAILPNKSSGEVGKALDNIFAKWPVCDRLETDEGGEFLRLKTIGYFTKKKIFWHPKKPPNKAAYAENAVFQIKRKLYLEMRRSNSHDWPSLLAQITLNFNTRKHASLGGLRPIDLNSKEKSVLLDDYVSKQEPNFRDFEAGRQDFKRQSQIQVGSFVFIYKPYKRRKQRGFDIQQGALFKVRKVDATQKPWLFYLANLVGKPVEDRSFYAKELKLYPEGPQPNLTFEVRAIRATRERDGRTQYLASFKGYPRSMDRWIYRDNLLK